MILSVFAYNIEAEALHQMLGLLGEAGRAANVSFRVEAVVSNVSDATALIRGGEGLALILLGVDDRETDPHLFSIRLGRLAKQVNRDHYVVYVLKKVDSRLLPFMNGAAGILPLPLTANACKPVFEHVVQDFQRFFTTDETAGTWITLKAQGNKLHRVRVEDICSVQAANKMIEVHTMQQVITLYDKLEAMEELLGESFVRCHRSYLVNRERIEYIDLKNKLIHMMDGSGIPFSRSSKDSIQRIALESEA